MTDWQKVEMSPTWDYESEKELTGVYLSMEQHVGPNDSNLYNVQRSDESNIGIWGTSLLDSKFKNVKLGEEIKVVYLGMAKGEKSGREYHNFDVYHRPAQVKNTFEED